MIRRLIIINIPSSLLVLLLLIMFSLAVNFMTDDVKLVVLAATSFVLSLYAVKVLWFDPWKIRRMLQMQGIKGPKPSFVYGNVWEMRRIEAAASAGADQNGEFVAHDYTSTLFPYFEKWRKEYGPMYTYSTGRKQHLYVNQPELVKELWRCTCCQVGKPLYVTKKLAPLLGNGILRSNGHMWSHQRKLLAPHFSMDKLKGTVGLMVECAESLTKKWEEYIDAQGGERSDIRVEEDLRSFSADVISMSFGSSYLKAKAVCSKLRTLQKLVSKQSFLFGSHAFRLFPTRNQKEIVKLEKEIESLIWEAVKERQANGNAENDNKDLLLQLILEGATSKSFVVDNFKNIYFAGHESTAVAASWCLMLLALHPQWQEEIREEVDRACNEDGGGLINADSLHRLKTVTMVIQEVLRLYPPAAFVSREALKETKLGHVTVPKGVCMWTLIPTLHRDVGVWGPDVNEFNPRRFVDAPHQVYIPFGLGPRLCLGRNFAMSQLKVVVAAIVSKFRFGLSPEYRHSPAYRMIVEPGQGVCLVVQRR